MPRLGLVDLGSNTARLVVYAYEPGAWFHLDDEIREPVRLGEGLADTGRLSAAAQRRALDALGMYADFAGATGLDGLEVIATSAVRDAANRDAFLEKVRALGVNVEVLPGEDEARLGVLAVANSLAFHDAWVMDLGGGSAQLSRMRGRRYEDGTAHPLGAVRLTEAFLRNDPPKASEVAALEKFASGELGAVLERVRAEPGPLVAMGGTIRNLARAVQKASDYPLDLLHGYVLSRDALEALIEQLLARKGRDRAAIGGIHPDRADVILAGALVYRAVLRGANLESVIVSGQGVREGAFYRRFLPEPHLVADVRAFSVHNLFRRYAQPLAHVDRVRALAVELFDGLRELHPDGAAERRLLEDAATLHDIGMAIGYHDHHKHGAYLVSADSLPGFSHREHALLALLVHYHRKGDPKPGALRALLLPDDAARLARLAACLRLAEYLERSRSGRVRRVNVSVTARHVRVEVVANGDATVELLEARKQSGLFRKAFGRDLELTVVAP